jgi:hypothetical protein
MDQASHAQAYRYRAFISYSHHDKAWADWLHRGLETYRVPARLVGRRTRAGMVTRRLAPIFRDRDELASSPDLGDTVAQALGQSANLVVICSPAAAASHWVNQELETFRRLGRGDRIFCLIVAGEPNAGPPDECLPPALRPDHAHGAEPLAADVRPGKDGKSNAKLKLVAGLLDLELDQLRRRELQRRNRRLTAVAALTTVVMLATSLLAIEAVLARHAAERRQKQAEDLVGFMLGDLNDKLAQVQRLDIMEAVDDKAMAYFRSLPANDVTDDALEQRVKALEKIGSVRLDQGHLAPATSAFQAAVPLARRLAEAAPTDRERQIAYARVQAFIGMADWYRGDLDEAASAFAAAQSTLERMGAVAGEDPQVLFELSSLDNDIGHVLEARGRLGEAGAHYRRMLERCRRLALHPSPKREWLEHLGEAHNNLGKLALMQGQLLPAIAEYAADDAIETRLANAKPDDNDQRENMARVRAILGRTLLLAGEDGRAADALAQALSTAEDLHRFDPTQVNFQDKVGLYATQLGRLRRLQGDTRAAAALLARAVGMLQALARHDPDNTDWQQDLAQAQTERAAVRLALGERAAALVDAREAARVLAAQLASQPQERTLLLASVRADLQLAELQDAAGARRLREQALQRLADVRGGAADVRLLALRVDALLALGRAGDAQPLARQLWTSGYRDAALVQELRQARIPFPPNPAFAQRLRGALDGAALADAR